MGVNYFESAQKLFRTGTSFVTVTMIQTRGHAPQDAGAKAIITQTGLEWGTVGGGKVEAKAITRAIDILASDPKTRESVTELLTWNLQRDVGMSCGGEVQFLFELFTPNSWKVFIFGSGHVAQEIVRFLLRLNCQVTCIDTRPEWLQRLPKDEPHLISILCQDYTEIISQVPKDAFCVVSTRGHATDIPVLHGILKSHLPPYLGVIGSLVKAIKIKDDLKKMGHSKVEVDHVFCPMGVDIGNHNDPAEIAVSIVAQLIKIRG